MTFTDVILYCLIVWVMIVGFLTLKQEKRRSSDIINTSIKTHEIIKSYEDSKKSLPSIIPALIACLVIATIVYKIKNQKSKIKINP